MKQWTTEDILDQSGKIAIVTGSNTGIGFDTARMPVESIQINCRKIK